MRWTFEPRRRPEPALDVGLPAERTAMAWQRTGLTLAAFSALVVHQADRNILAAVPGVVGLLVALYVIVLAERRYAWVVRRVEAGESPLDRRLNLVLMAGIVMLSVASLALVVAWGL
jgi:putative membrane protein